MKTIDVDFAPDFERQLIEAEKTASLHSNQNVESFAVGAPIGLWTKLGTREAKRHGLGLIALVALVRFDQNGIADVTDLRVRDPLNDATRAVSDELVAKKADAIARRVGFENWAACWDWNDKHRDLQERRMTKLCRTLIVWRPLTPEQTAAIDQGTAVLEEIA